MDRDCIYDEGSLESFVASHPTYIIYINEICQVYELFRFYGLIVTNIYLEVQ